MYFSFARIQVGQSFSKGSPTSNLWYCTPMFGLSSKPKISSAQSDKIGQAEGFLQFVTAHCLSYVSVADCSSTSDSFKDKSPVTSARFCWSDFNSTLAVIPLWNSSSSGRSHSLPLTMPTWQAKHRWQVQPPWWLMNAHSQNESNGEVTK